MGDLLERSLPRLLLESCVGALGGFVLAHLLPVGEARVVLFAVGGALAAPLALMLTPVRGSVRYRALRYGLALMVLLMLAVSFGAGADALSLEQLLGFGAVIFSAGALAHALLAIVTGGADQAEDDASPPGPEA